MNSRAHRISRFPLLEWIAEASADRARATDANRYSEGKQKDAEEALARAACVGAQTEKTMSRNHISAAIADAFRAEPHD